MRIERPSTLSKDYRTLNELLSLSPDFIERGHELCPSFVDLMELPSRVAGRERDKEAAAQASHLRMSAKPTDGLLVCLAAVRAGNLDLGIIDWAFGGDTSPLSEKPRIGWLHLRPLSTGMPTFPTATGSFHWALRDRNSGRPY
jgi:hypothetical protein